jgi:F0F1-type ATP synthase membrane subunit b/b'
LTRSGLKGYFDITFSFVKREMSEMATITNIISALGINQTLWVQLALFLFAYLFLRYFVFQPYFRAFEDRQSKTTGNQEKAEQIFSQTRELEAMYQRKARGLNADVKTIYDKARLEATIEQERIHSEAREKAKASLDKARLHIQEQVAIARAELDKQAPELSRAIAERLLPTEVKQ